MAFHHNQRLRAAMRGNLTSIALFVFYNIAIGQAVSRIDNAAHLGGLVTGAILGWLLVYPVANKKSFSASLLERKRASAAVRKEPEG